MFRALVGDKTSLKPRRIPAVQRHAVGAVLGLTLLMSGGCGIKDPVVNLRDIQLESLGAQRVGLCLNFDVFNPNIVSFNLKDFRFTLIVDGVELASGTLERPVEKFKSMKTVQVRVPVSVEYPKLSRPAGKYKRHEALEYVVNGKAAFSCLGFHRSMKWETSGLLQLARLPKWRFRRLRLLRGAPPGVEVVFQVRNPNPFDLSITGLNGSLIVDGQSLLEVEKPSLPVLGANTECEVVIPVRMKLLKAARVIAAAARTRKIPKFECSFRVYPAVSLLVRLAGAEKDQ